MLARIAVVAAFLDSPDFAEMLGVLAISGALVSGMPRKLCARLATICCGALAACSGGPQLPSLSTASLPSVTLGETGIVAANTTEVYTRVAHAANVCWFGPGGRFRQTHIMHADADSPQKGGAVEIIVHERALDQPKIWGFKAYRVAIAESGGQALVSVENMRMSEIEEQRMRKEVLRWADGKDQCEVAPVVEMPPEPAPAKGKAKGKAAKK